MESIIDAEAAERDRASTDTKILSFFFHSDGEVEQREGSSNGLYRSLCYQLLEDEEDLLSQFMAETGFDRKYSKQKENWIWRNRMLQNFLIKVLRADRLRSHKVAIYIDALDEAGDETAGALASFFKILLTRSTATVGICVASRSYSSTGRSVLSTHDCNGDLILENRNEQDIRAYVEA